MSPTEERVLAFIQEDRKVPVVREAFSLLGEPEELIDPALAFLKEAGRIQYITKTKRYGFWRMAP